MVRIKVACKNVSTIHRKRLFEMGGNIYII
jgi:hypothetical protein